MGKKHILWSSRSFFQTNIIPFLTKRIIILLLRKGEKLKIKNEGRKPTTLLENVNCPRKGWTGEDTWTKGPQANKQANNGQNIIVQRFKITIIYNRATTLENKINSLKIQKYLTLLRRKNKESRNALLEGSRVLKN